MLAGVALLFNCVVVDGNWDDREPQGGLAGLPSRLEVIILDRSGAEVALYRRVKLKEKEN